MTLGIVRERVQVAGVPVRIGVLKIFSPIRVRTLAGSMAGKYFIHCCTPLGQASISETKQFRHSLNVAPPPIKLAQWGVEKLLEISEFFAAL